MPESIRRMTVSGRWSVETAVRLESDTPELELAAVDGRHGGDPGDRGTPPAATELLNPPLPPLPELVMM